MVRSRVLSTDTGVVLSSAPITAPRREAQVHAGHHRGCRSALITGLPASAAPRASLNFPLEVPGLDVNAVQFRM